jgi:hypothetical protein
MRRTKGAAALATFGGFNSCSEITRLRVRVRYRRVEAVDALEIAEKIEL